MARVMHLMKGRCEPRVEALGDLSVNVQPAKGITEASLGGREACTSWCDGHDSPNCPASWLSSLALSNVFH